MSSAPKGLIPTAVLILFSIVVLLEFYYISALYRKAPPLKPPPPTYIRIIEQHTQIQTVLETQISWQTVTLSPTSTMGAQATAIPEKIWYKLGPKGVPEDLEQGILKCLQKNPTYRYEFLTDVSAEQYVRDQYAHRPDIVTIYNSLRVPILKADLLRYLILYANGGIWSDLDVSCEDPPIHSWIPPQYRDKTSLVVGLEFDSKWENDSNIHSQFASWTIMARPGVQHMAVVVDDIIADFYKIAEENRVTIDGLEMGMISDVVDVTGPKRMTLSIVKSLQSMLRETIDDRNISGLTEPHLVGDVLILPANSFAAGQAGHPKDQGPVLITHHYAGTWKNDRGGEYIGGPGGIEEIK